MNGGDFHEFMLDDLAQEFERFGVEVSRQARSCLGRYTGYVDMLVPLEPEPLAIEAEMSARRVENDIQKARELGAQLWIVVPNCRVADAVKRRLRQLGSRKTKGTFVLTLGLARQRVRDCFSISRRSMVNRKTNTQPAKNNDGTDGRPLPHDRNE